MLLAIDNSKRLSYGAATTSALIIFSYGFFLACLWPGLLGEDSLAALTFIDGTNTFPPGKPAFWVYFLDFLYGTSKRVEAPIIVLAALSTLILSRVQIFLWHKKHYKSFFFCLIFIALAPHIIELNIALFGDGIFAIATAGLFFELYLVCKSRKVTLFSAVFIAVLAPFALFTRTNGIISFIPLLLAAIALTNKDRFIIASIIAINICGMVAMNQLYKHKSQGALAPLIVWETVNFLQPTGSRMVYTRDRVTAKTIETLKELAPIETYTNFYDPEYWDSLNFYADGPRVSLLTDSQEKIIISEFFKHNLWNNFPAFISSRVRVFLASSLAYSSLPWGHDPEIALKRTESVSTALPLKSYSWSAIPQKIFHISYKARYFLWNPIIGIALIFATLYHFRKKLYSVEFSIAATYTIQVFGIFIFSIASEYRYTTILFLAPLVLLPILADRSDGVNPQRDKLQAA